MVALFHPQKEAFLRRLISDRYFFTGGVLLIIFAILDRRLISLAILVQVSSLLSSIAYFSSWSDDLVKIGAGVNCVLIIALFLYYHDYRIELSKTDPILGIPLQTRN
jgi:hypothetical protein